jgi:hypothetical protein
LSDFGVPPVVVVTVSEPLDFGDEFFKGGEGVSVVVLVFEN